MQLTAVRCFDIKTAQMHTCQPFAIANFTFNFQYICLVY